MTLTKSKQTLARIIHQHGGWRLGGEYAAQDKDDFSICFYVYGKPTREVGCEYWSTYGSVAKVMLGEGRLKATELCSNWSQTILSREEYHSLYPEQLQPELQYCESVTRTIPDPDQPTIESLAADYRAKLAIYEQAQEELNAHRCGVEAALSRLQLAGWSIGLSISPQADGPKSENEPLNITDWRDLKVGDVISWLSYDPHYKYDECEIIKVESAEYDGTKTILVDVGNNNHYWVDVKDDSWRFIRRP